MTTERRPALHAEVPIHRDEGGAALLPLSRQHDHPDVSGRVAQYLISWEDFTRIDF